MLMQSQARESSDKPMLNAFCLVAPSVRFRVRAILPAVAFLLASRFISRTSLAVQARRFFPFLMGILSPIMRLTLLAGSSSEGKPHCSVRNFSDASSPAILRLACTRFRRHRVRCFDGTGGESWRDGSLHA